MPPPHPPDDPVAHHHHPMSFSSLVPPPMILVPHPVIVPIIIPVPLPLSAFWNAYQVKKSTATSSEHDNNNESHRGGGGEEEKEATREKADENEQPLDYTTSKSPENNDNNLPLHEDDNENENNGIDSISSDRIANSSNGNNAERIPKFKITRLHNMRRALSRDSGDFANESCRPLRKRRIIAEVDNFSESP